jgi:acetyltransferase-like isoleucine patch superfamily enzyme
LGINSTIGHNVTIEDENFIGANTLVTKSTEEKEVFISKEGEKFRLDSRRFLQFTGV